MGVDGYELLDIAHRRNVIAIMLKAHVLSPEDTIKSYKKGAASYVPKDEIANIITFLNDILEAKVKGRNIWWRWLDHFGRYYDSRSGPDWKNKDSEFWKKFPPLGLFFIAAL